MHAATAQPDLPVPISALAWAAGRQRDRIAEMLAMVAGRVALQRRLVHAGDAVCQAGSPFVHLFVVNAGFFKIVNTAADGRDQVVGLQFRGDWLGFDGIATGRYGCDAVALDTGEVWALCIADLLRAGAAHPALLAEMHVQMSRTIMRGRDAMLSLCTLPVAARVAGFLLGWAESVSATGQRIDEVTLRMTRAEIGNFLGMTLESVSRALSGLVRVKVIRFDDPARRHILIPDLRALADYTQGRMAAARQPTACVPSAGSP